ncbi:hypothetical protein I302_106036 [Kwoniella bestiolae CBS 10118]|uniref:Uncharacterized protein n=1 Tax=Kwoniella bestiolae CBS 10118 TaxID=1296100 RepID=A0A1B9G2T6_9TREE|nr:hypothetical protein I302_05160 [Kwoniella bestiolae CBS 10118]OCF25343.1 hypothetical protein I302_05160 [Kwoniella bestiolae CBS 10118]
MIHDINNTSLELEFGVLALNLRNMWYQHGYSGLRYFKQHIADIYKRFELLLDEDKVDPETVRAAETACNDLLALHAVPNETWLPYVTSIKRRLSQSSSTSGGSSVQISPSSSLQNSPTEEKSSHTYSYEPYGSYGNYQYQSSGNRLSHRRATT